MNVINTITNISNIKYATANRLQVVPDSRTTPPPPLLTQRIERPVVTLRRSSLRPTSPPLEKTPDRIGYEDEARPQSPPPQPEMSLFQTMFDHVEPAEKPKTKLWPGKKKVGVFDFVIKRIVI